MQVIIFTSIGNKKLLQQILDWGVKSPLKFQMYFCKDKKNVLQFSKDGFVVTTDSNVAKILKQASKKFVFIEKDWIKGTKNVF